MFFSTLALYRLFQFFGYQSCHDVNTGSTLLMIQNNWFHSFNHYLITDCLMENPR